MSLTCPLQSFTLRPSLREEKGEEGVEDKEEEGGEDGDVDGQVVQEDGEPFPPWPGSEARLAVRPWCRLGCAGLLPVPDRRLRFALSGRGRSPLAC